MARNKKAGNAPSYDKRGMSESSRRKKRAYDKKLNNRPEQIQKRVESNRKRREAKKNGKNVNGKDYDHATNRFVKTSTNRGRKGEGGRVKK